MTTPAPQTKHLSVQECRLEYESALDDVDALVRVTEPRDAFITAFRRSETWRRFLTHPHAQDVTA